MAIFSLIAIIKTINMVKYHQNTLYRYTLHVILNNMDGCNFYTKHNIYMIKNPVKYVKFTISF